MCSDLNPIDPILEYELTLLKKVASELEDLKKDVLILETVLENYQKNKNLHHGDCLLDVKGFSFTKKLTKHDFTQLLDILMKKNQILEKNLVKLRNVNKKRNKAINVFIDLCHELLAYYFESNDEDVPYLLRKENVEILLKKIFKILADEAIIKHQTRVRDETLDNLQTKIDQYSSLLVCIKHKQNAQEHYIELEQLRETSTKLELENKELSEEVKDLTQVYNDLVFKMEGLKELEHHAIHQLLKTDFLPQDKDFRRLSSKCDELMERSSKSVISVRRSNLRLVEGKSSKKEELNRLLDATEYMMKNQKKLEKFKRQMSRNQIF